MKILGINGSSRSDRKSGCHKLVETALDASGCEHELVSLRGKKILGCKITEEITPAVEKQPEVMQAAVDAGKELGRRLSEGHDRATVAAKMQQQMMEKFKEST